jgi:threonine/homoserine/homoserine lactone efflux protein
MTQRRPPCWTDRHGGRPSSFPACHPKAAVFAFSFYPQFIPDGANVLATSVLLGAVHVLVDMCWYSIVALTVTRLRALFLRSELKRWLERVVGTVLVALGLRLAID